MNKTQIEWVKNPDGTQGFTWNPITGCLNNCEYCYARKLANTRLRIRYIENMNLAIPIPQDKFPNGLAYGDPFYPRFWEDRMGYRTREKSTPRGIFVCDMSDLFGIGIPKEWTRRVLNVIQANPWHRFYLLTKQPQNLAKFSPFPENVWLGVSATSQSQFDEAVKYLKNVQANVRFISFEPLLERIKLVHFDVLNWVIVGAQSKPTVYPEIGWVQGIALAATKANIPLFLKDNLKSLLPNRMPFWGTYIWKELSVGVPVTMSESRYRQEMPQGEEV